MGGDHNGRILHQFGLLLLSNPTLWHLDVLVEFYSKKAVSGEVHLDAFITASGLFSPSAHVGGLTRGIGGFASLRKIRDRQSMLPTRDILELVAHQLVTGFSLYAGGDCPFLSLPSHSTKLSDLCVLGPPVVTTDHRNISDWTMPLYRSSLRADALDEAIDMRRLERFVWPMRATTEGKLLVQLHYCAYYSGARHDVDYTEIDDDGCVDTSSARDTLDDSFVLHWGARSISLFRVMRETTAYRECIQRCRKQV